MAPLEVPRTVPGRGVLDMTAACLAAAGPDLPAGGDMGEGNSNVSCLLFAGRLRSKDPFGSVPPPERLARLRGERNSGILEAAED